MVMAAFDMAVSIFLGVVFSKPWRAAPLYRQESFFVGEASSLDHRGWEAALTEHDPTFLEAGILDMSASLHS
jgi:hypothetical protein